MNLLLNRGLDRLYFPKLAKSLFIADFIDQKDAEKQEFEAEGL